MRPLSDLTNSQVAEDSTAAQEYHNAMMCTSLAGRAIIRIVGRCNDAVENENLDLSDCLLTQIPEAIWFLLRHTSIKTCDLSFNVITKIPAKLGTKFSCITELNISNNRIGKLPDELSDLQELAKLDISFNSFCSLPKFIYVLPKLESINAEKNFIIDVDAGRLGEVTSLNTVNLTNNPVSKNSHDALTSLTSVTVILTARVVEDWERWTDESSKS